MPHGERSRRLTNNSTRDYWQRRHGNASQSSGRPTDGHADPRSTKRLTRRAERRASRQRGHDA